MTIFRTVQAFMGALLALSLGLLAGCASPGVGPAGVANTNQPTATAPEREITTASDETDVSKRARIRIELASAYFAQGQLTTALDEVKRALAIDNNISEAYELRGLIYDALGEPGLSEESFKRAIQLDARNGSALHNYAWSLCNKQQYPAADALFERAAELPQSVIVSKTLLARGVCQIRAGLLPAAEQSLIRSYELDPSSPATAYNLALVLYRRGEYERSRFYIRRVNNVPEQITAESIWLGIRVENRMNNISGRDELATMLRSRFPNSREATALELGRFDD
ncbi:MAG: type IV pilus biogenesis/stability protein PilW [Burkholderiales bacterium]|nr:type IV pilus biogenesis/stability protein PilW [Burkholderiales bacterium]